MKSTNLINFTFIVVAFCIFFSSCNSSLLVEKRRYRKGFYISVSSNEELGSRPKPKRKIEEIKLAKADTERIIEVAVQEQKFAEVTIIEKEISVPSLQKRPTIKTENFITKNKVMNGKVVKSFLPKTVFRKSILVYLLSLLLLLICLFFNAFILGCALAGVGFFISTFLGFLEINKNADDPKKWISVMTTILAVISSVMVFFALLWAIIYSIAFSGGSFIFI